jgi:1,2-dihydroxy-3-keto-5-methylthiopentene dioxygenase
MTKEQTMTLLQIMPDDEPDVVRLRTEDTEKIASELAAIGVEFERWTADVALADDADSDAVLAAYRADVDQLIDKGGFRLVDVVRLRPDDDDPDWLAKAKAARGKFLDEHTHDEDEVRFFVEGTGCFYLHVGGQVYAVVCQAGDLLSVPRGTTHWFDMGERPHFAAIRFFEAEDGWIGNFTKNTIAARFPSLDALLA